MYLNKFDFLHLAVGVKSAAQIYFNRGQDSLEIQQAAMLVGMAKNPALFDPIRRPDTVLHRRNVVLYQMTRFGDLTKEKYDSLLQLYPQLFQKVPKQLIASYLGVTRETLSRFNSPSK